MKKTLFTLITVSTLLMANQKDIYIQGCQDIMKNRSTIDANYILGFVNGTQILGWDVLKKMGKPPVVAIDLKDLQPICRQFLSYQSEMSQKNIPSVFWFSLVIRGYLVHINGYTWEEIQERVKEIQQKLGLIKKKKY